MNRRVSSLALAAAVLVALPAAVLGQDRPVAVRPGDPSLPKMLGGSGWPLPAGAVEVVQAGEGASRSRAAGGSEPLAPSLGWILKGVDGDVFSGPCELAVRGGVSYYIPRGSRARAVLEKNGDLTLQPLEGSVYGRNAEVTLLVRAGGSITSTPEGRFVGLAGGDVYREQRWIGFSGEGGLGDINRVFRDIAVFRDVPPPGGAVSGSRAFR
jgi:hypothetical protein